MKSSVASIPGMEAFEYSRVLQRALSSITDIALARIDLQGGALCLTTLDGSEGDGRSRARGANRYRGRRPMLIEQGPGDLVSIEPVTEADGFAALTRAMHVPGRWRVVTCRFESGSADQIALRLTGSAQDKYCNQVVSAIWPVLREDCIRDVAGIGASIASHALTWTAAKKTDAAILILNGRGEVLESNEAARELLEEGQLLQLRHGRLESVRPRTTGRSLPQVIAACADGTGDRERILFLEDGNEGLRVPIALSRYQDPRASEALVVAMLPRQPDIKRIEKLAQMMGLTPAESRVAALMQLGHSNREAARIAGLKEQTFNTYAKRALSKLNVGCRAEMAHLLTWQAALGRAS